MRPRPSLVVVLLLVALSCETEFGAMGMATTAKTRTKFGSASFKDEPLNARTLEKSGNEDHYHTAWIPIVCFAIIMMIPQGLVIISDNAQSKHCELHNPPAGMEYHDRSFSPFYERGQVDLGKMTPVMITQNPNPNADKSTLGPTLDLYDFNHNKKGAIGLLLFDSEIIETDNVEQGEVLVGINCQPFDDSTEAGRKIFAHPQDYVDEVGKVDRGSALAAPVTFNFIRPKTTDTGEFLTHWCDEEPLELSVGNHVQLQSQECPDSDADDLMRFFMYVKGNVLSHPASEEIQKNMHIFGPKDDTGRDSLGLRSAKETKTRMLMTFLVAVFSVVVALVPSIIGMSSVDDEKNLLNSEAVSARPGLFILQTLGGPLLMVGICVVDIILMKLMSKKLNSKYRQAIFSGFVMLIAMMLPLRLFVLTKKASTYETLYALHLMEFALTYINHILAMAFFAHSLTVWFKGTLGLTTPFVFTDEMAELILGVSGACASVVEMIQQTRDAHGMGDQCDLNTLRTISEEATVNITDKKFSIDCSEWPSGASDDPKPSNQWGWDDLSPTKGNSQVEVLSNRKDVSDQASCIIYCTVPDYGTHQTLTKCTDAGLVGGQWSLLSQPILLEHLCYTSETGFTFSSRESQRAELSITPPGHSFTPEGPGGVAKEPAVSGIGGKEGDWPVCNTAADILDNALDPGNCTMFLAGGQHCIQTPIEGFSCTPSYCTKETGASPVIGRLELGTCSRTDARLAMVEKDKTAWVDPLSPRPTTLDMRADVDPVLDRDNADSLKHFHM